MSVRITDEAARVLADPQAATDERRLHEALAHLRAHAPVSWVDVEPFAPFWAITKHADVMDIERQNDLFTNDPRAVLLKKYARHMAQIRGYEAEFDLLQKVEELGIPLVQERRHSDTPMCANVDMYSGLVYKMLKIPVELYTPLFAVSRMAGWAAHRLEEMLTCGRIIRPAYKAIAKQRAYVPFSERED